MAIEFYKSSKLTITTLPTKELVLIDTGFNKLNQTLVVPQQYIVMFNPVLNNFYALSLDYQTPNDQIVTYL